MRHGIFIWYAVFAVAYFYALRDKRRGKSAIDVKSDDTIYIDERDEEYRFRRSGEVVE